MSDPELHPAVELDAIVQQRGALPDAPLAMPVQRLEGAAGGWRGRIASLLRRPHVPHGI